MILRALMIAAAGLTLMIANASAQTKGPNGGIVVRADDHPVEFVFSDQQIVFYVGDHDGKPMPTKGLKARAVVQVGGKTTTIALSPAEPESVRRQARGPAGIESARGVLQRVRRSQPPSPVRHAVVPPVRLPAPRNCVRSPAIRTH